MICTQDQKQQRFNPQCAHTLASIQMISCSTSTNGASAVQWEVCECGLPNMPTGPCELAPVTLLPPRLSPPDRTAPVTTVLALPTGYNYSAFCCSLPLSCFPCLSPSLSLSLSQPGWVLTPRSRRRAAGPLLCAHNALNATHCTVAPNRWGVVMWKREGGVTHCMPRPLGWRGGGGRRGGWRGPAAQQPTYPLLPFSLFLSISSFSSHFLSLSPSFSPWAAGRSFVPVPPLSCPSACWRRDASELSTTEEGGGGGGGGKQKIESKGRR